MLPVVSSTARTLTMLNMPLFILSRKLGVWRRACCSVASDRIGERLELEAASALAEGTPLSAFSFRTAMRRPDRRRSMPAHRPGSRRARRDRSGTTRLSATTASAGELVTLPSRVFCSTAAEARTRLLRGHGGLLLKAIDLRIVPSCPSTPFSAATAWRPAASACRRCPFRPHPASAEPPRCPAASAIFCSQRRGVEPGLRRGRIACGGAGGGDCLRLTPNQTWHHPASYHPSPWTLLVLATDAICGCADTPTACCTTPTFPARSATDVFRAAIAGWGSGWLCSVSTRADRAAIFWSASDAPDWVVV